MFAMRADDLTNDAASFGPFTLHVRNRILLRDGVKAAIGERALDLLIALVSHAGQVCESRELIEKVWSHKTVGDSNLHVQITTLRKILGEGTSKSRYVVTVPGRGYVFVAPIRQTSSLERAPTTTIAPRQSPSVAPLSLVGRDTTIAQLRDQLMTHRFVSVLGPGGIGKTSVATAIAQSLIDEFGADAIHFVDLGTTTDPSDVPRAIASSLNSSLGDSSLEGPISELLLRAFLANKRLLLLLDCCEHVIEPIAALCEWIFHKATSVHLLVTSREALRVDGEFAYFLKPLDLPMNDNLSAAESLTWPAVRLFMERATQSVCDFALSDEEAPTVIEICRRLDGIPLSIELTAGHVSVYGIKGTASLLDSGAELHLSGRRNAQPRHSSLQAMLDWSYELLSTEERDVLCKLAIFVNKFTLDAAQSVAGRAPQITANAVWSLSEKSLIQVSNVTSQICFRLLDTTRDYAAAKLAGSADARLTALRHASYHAKLLQEMRGDSSNFDIRYVEVLGPRVGEIRKALSWSFSEEGDSRIGVLLTVYGGHLLLDASLFSECRNWCRLALCMLDEADRGTWREMELLRTLAISATYTKSDDDEILKAFSGAISIAESLSDSRQQIHLYAGLHVFLCRKGDFRAALEAAKQSAAAASISGSISERAIAEWILGPAYHLAGDQASGLKHCESGFQLAEQVDASELNFFGHDQYVRAEVAFSQCLWHCGFHNKAIAMARESSKKGLKLARPISSSILLVYSSELLLNCGEYEFAKEPIEFTIRQAEKYSLRPYFSVGLFLKGQLAVETGDAASGIHLLRQALSGMYSERYHLLTSAASASLAMGLCAIGQAHEALAIADSALERARSTGVSRGFPTLIRARGEALTILHDYVGAEACFVESIESARSQASVSLELKAAIPLARLWKRQGNVGQSIDLIERICAKFPEISQSRDLIAARAFVTDVRLTPLAHS